MVMTEQAPMLRDSASAVSSRFYNAPWTEERVDRLKRLWDSGLSAGKIAAELGSVTRNAVIGKVQRLGLLGRAKNPPRSTPRHIVQARARQKYDHGGGIRERLKSKVRRNAMARPETAESFPSESTSEFDAAIPIEQRCTLLDLTAANCHWPVGDPGTPGFFFCGGAAAPGSPYCVHHSRVAYPCGERMRPKEFIFSPGLPA